MSRLKSFLVVFLLLLLPVLSWGANGDISAVRINALGWYAEVDVSGLAVGGTYDLGMGANNDPSAGKMVFTVTSQGYDDAGSATTLSRTVYGTNYKRKAYPDNATADETAGEGIVTVTIALSDYVYSSDTLTVTMSSGVYTESATPTAAVTDLAVMNNSTAAYPKVVGNWSWPGYSRITGSYFNLRAVAFHRSAQQGRPVRAVNFTCTDQHSNTATATVTAATIDTSMADAEKVIEYVGAISTTSLTQGDTLTCNFTAYPWYGDEDSLLDTGDAANTMPTPLYAPQYYLLDKTGAYGVTVAVVDSALADDTGGEAVDYAAFDPETTGAFKNIFAAVNAIAVYNNENHSRGNTAAGIIYLKEGSHVWTGGTVTTAGKATGPCWLTVTKFPGTTRANVLISSAATTKQASEHLKLEDVKITNSTVGGFDAMDAVWVHNCDLDSTGAATFYTNKVLYITSSNLWSCDIFRPYSTVVSPRALIRGNMAQEDLGNSFAPYTCLGNSLKNADFSEYTFGSQPAFTNLVIAYNKISKSTDSPAFKYLNTTLTDSHGAAIVQNLVEKYGSVGTSPTVWIAADGSTGNPVNNVIMWNNTILGQRANLAYNDYVLNDVTPPVYRINWHLVGNVFDDYNCITDIDSHGGTEDGDRIGNHSIIHGVGQIGTAVLNRVGVTGYNNKFGGLYHKFTGSSIAPYFVNDQSSAVTGTGNGYYHLHSNSPLCNLSKGTVLPYDLDGNRRRREADDAGCYTRGLGKVF